MVMKATAWVEAPKEIVSVIDQVKKGTHVTVMTAGVPIGVLIPLADYHYYERLEDPAFMAGVNAPIDDEPVTPEEETAVAEAMDELKRGDVIALDELKRDLDI